MKTLPSGLAAHIAGGTTTLADLLKITRTDSTVFAFTSAADDVTISSVLYKSAQGLNISSLEASAGLNVDNLELSTLDDGTVFTKLDVLSGRWRNADFVISRYNWASPSDGVDVRMVGTIGEVRLHRGYVTAELRGLQQYLQQPIGSVSSKTCRARLGDALCTKDLASFTYAATVDTVASQQVFTLSPVVGSPGDSLYSQVVLLLHCNGTHGSTTFTDHSSAARTPTVTGTPIISTVASQFGGASLKFNGSPSLLRYANSTDWQFGTGDFCVEFWVNPSAIGADQALLAYANTTIVGAASFGWDIYLQDSGKIRANISNGATITTLDSTTTLTAGTFYKVAYVRTSGWVKLSISGTVEASAAFASSVYVSSAPSLDVGYVTSIYSTVYMDEIRITKGSARYTGNFTPETAEFYNQAPVAAWPSDVDYFANGVLTWTAGANAGLSAKMKSSTSLNQITLSLPMLGLISPGDTLDLIAGCQKRLDDCATKFSNVLNFQGEPHLPGIDEVVQ